MHVGKMHLEHHVKSMNNMEKMMKTVEKTMKTMEQSMKTMENQWKTKKMWWTPWEINASNGKINEGHGQSNAWTHEGNTVKTKMKSAHENFFRPKMWQIVFLFPNAANSKEKRSKLKNPGKF